MPVYICPANLIVDKAAVAARYPGGIDVFRRDFRIDGENHHQEDGELFALVGLNVEDLDVDRIVEAGLHFDEAAQYSNDFVVKPRYGEALWPCAWLLADGLYAWHVNAPAAAVAEAERINNLTMDEIMAMQDQGLEPLGPIR